MSKVEDEKRRISSSNKDLILIGSFAKNLAMNWKNVISDALSVKFPIILKKNCWFKEQGKNSKEKYSIANFAKEDDAEKLFYSSTKAEHGIKNIWYLDSGCSHHIIEDRKCFMELHENFSTQVELGDSKQVTIEGQGIIVVHTNGGNKKHILDVY